MGDTDDRKYHRKKSFSQAIKLDAVIESAVGLGVARTSISIVKVSGN